MQGWDADTHLEHPSLSMGAPLEDLDITLEEREENISSQLKQSADAKRALILKVSHTGGHKYAGNCIVSYPHAAVVYYGGVFTSTGRYIHLQDPGSGMAGSPRTM